MVITPFDPFYHILGRHETIINCSSYNWPDKILKKILRFFKKGCECICLVPFFALPETEPITRVQVLYPVSMWGRG